MVGRLAAWSAGSLGFLGALFYAGSQARDVLAPYIDPLSQAQLLFGGLFCPVSSLVLIWLWPSFVRRQLSVDSSWLKILRTFAAVLIGLVVVGLAISAAASQFGLLWVWVLLAAAVDRWATVVETEARIPW